MTRLRHTALLSLIALALAFTVTVPASAQVWIAPDHSIVYIGRQQPIPIGGTYYITGVVVRPNGQYVRVNVPVSAAIVNPNRGFVTGPVFVKPFTATERARLSNFYR